MEGKNIYFRCISLFYFRKGKNASQTHKKICAVYGENALSESVCRKWFAKFRCGDFDLQDAPRSGRPVTTDVDQIKTLIDSNRHLTTTEIGHNLDINQSTVSRHLRKLRMIKKERRKKKGEKKLNVKVTRGRKETGTKGKTRAKAEEAKRRKEKRERE